MSIASTKFAERLQGPRQVHVSRNGELVSNPITLMIKVEAFSTKGSLFLNGKEIIASGTKAELFAEADRIEALSDEAFQAEFSSVLNPQP